MAAIIQIHDEEPLGGGTAPVSAPIGVVAVAVGVAFCVPSTGPRPSCASLLPKSKTVFPPPKVPPD